MMEKPITVMMDEYREGLVAVMNGSGLPAWLQLYVLRPLVAQLDELATVQAAEDKARWQGEQKNGD